MKRKALGILIVCTVVIAVLSSGCAKTEAPRARKSKPVMIIVFFIGISLVYYC